MKNRGLIIIPPDMEEKEIYDENFDISIRHYEKIVDYIIDNDLSIEVDDVKSSYKLSIELARQNHCVILTEGNIKIIFLPLNVTEEQYKWFKENKTEKRFFSSKLAILSLVKNEKKEIELETIEETIDKKNLCNELYRILKCKKTIRKEKEYEYRKKYTEINK